MRLPLHLPVLLALTLTTGNALAQGGRPPIVAGQFGFNVTNGATSAGTLCSGFSCTPAKMNTKGGEKLTFTIRAPQNARYFMILGPKSVFCQTFPGFLNKWVVPVTILLPGTVNQFDTGPRCFGYKASLTVGVPNGIPKGTQVSLQALAEVMSPNGRKLPAFSSPIDVIVP
ncbi:MAG: hypothetical protein ACYST0_04835 [Planctomycetota bacterium]|jgi:hypothetical protein